MAEKIKAVDPLNGMTPAELQARIKAASAKRQAAQAAAREEKELLDMLAEQNAGAVEQIRFETFKIRERIAPLQEENERLIREHTDLLFGGAENVPTEPDEKGHAVRKESKIKFSEEERKKFASRMANEQKAAAKGK